MTAQPGESQLEAAYARCKAIARREARNFYYAFLALPEPKRNAICAVYAFMRRADDISDDASLPLGQRRRTLDSWLRGWHESVAAGTSNDPVFLALLDAQRLFAIPLELFDQLVEGTAADLAETETDGTEQGLSVFESFEQLYHYCYLVASVVGLVSIRIFGYHDPRAEKLAEETGIAFQLTNILRDVSEDGARGRVYLPLDDLRRFGVLPEDLASVEARRPPGRGEREAMAATAARAEHYYGSARLLIPLVAPDSRPALWVLISIYHRLLRRIENRRFDVFTSRVTVPAYEKLAWMGGGLGKLVVARLGARLQ